MDSSKNNSNNLCIPLAKQAADVRKLLERHLMKQLEARDVRLTAVIKSDSGLPPLYLQISLDAEENDYSLSFGLSITVEGRCTTNPPIDLLFRSSSHVARRGSAEEISHSSRVLMQKQCDHALYKIDRMLRIPFRELPKYTPTDQLDTQVKNWRLQTGWTAMPDPQALDGGEHPQPFYYPRIWGST